MKIPIMVRTIAKASPPALERWPWATIPQSSAMACVKSRADSDRRSEEEAAEGMSWKRWHPKGLLLIMIEKGNLV